MSAAIAILAPAAAGLGVGLSLGLTGGGGALVAMPVLLALGHSVPSATAASLWIVAALALIGAIAHLRDGSARWALALAFGIAGMLGTPLGAWLHQRLGDVATTVVFALVSVAVAVRLFRTPVDPPVASTPADDGRGPACRFDPQGHLRLNAPCSIRLGVIGIGTGIVAGLVGVGGGVLAVPAFMHLAGLSLRAAAATALVSTALVAGAGAAAHAVAGHMPDAVMLLPFIAGGVLGLWLGGLLLNHLPSILLRRGFAVLLIGVAAALLIRTARSLVYSSGGAS